MKKLAQSNPVLFFIFVTFSYSWSLWALMILSNRDLLPFRFPTNFLGSFGPAVGAIVLALVTDGRSGLTNLLKPLLRWKSSVSVYLFTLFLIVAIYILTVLVMLVVNPAVIAFGPMPDPVELILYFLIVAVVGGPLGEEIGWRGFLQPELQKRYTPLVASLWIALIWFTWHIPLFWLEGAAQEGGSILSFALSVFCMAFLFTWVYLRTNGSLFFAVLFHTSINFVSAVLFPALLPAAEKDKLFGYVFSGVLAAAALCFVTTSYRTFSVRSGPEQAS